MEYPLDDEQPFEDEPIEEAPMEEAPPWEYDPPGEQAPDDWWNYEQTPDSGEWAPFPPGESADPDRDQYSSPDSEFPPSEEDQRQALLDYLDQELTGGEEPDMGMGDEAEGGEEPGMGDEPAATPRRFFFTGGIPYTTDSARAELVAAGVPFAEELGDEEVRTALEALTLRRQVSTAEEAVTRTNRERFAEDTRRANEGAAIRREEETGRGARATADRAARAAEAAAREAAATGRQTAAERAAAERAAAQESAADRRQRLQLEDAQRAREAAEKAAQARQERSEKMQLMAALLQQSKGPGGPQKFRLALALAKSLGLPLEGFTWGSQGQYGAGSTPESGIGGAKPNPLAIPPAAWDRMSPSAKQLLLDSYEWEGGEPDDFLYNLEDQRPRGRAGTTRVRHAALT